MAGSDDNYVRDMLRLEGLLRGYLHRFAPKPADLEDLLQETYTRLLGVEQERRAAIKSLQPFALTVARNAALDWLRRSRIVPIDLVEDLDELPSALAEGASSVEDIVNAHQEVLRIAAAVADLPARCAEVFTLRKVYGWSQREIATHFGISISTVEAHLVKAVRRCSGHVAAPAVVPQPSSWLRRVVARRGKLDGGTRQ